MTSNETIETLKWMKSQVEWAYPIDYAAAIDEAIKTLEAQGESLSEWCTDCSEYDHERHCCPRFNRVIKKTLKEALEPYREEEHGQ